ncbi:MAG: F0F1 ATP synthase subunit B [Planctomycetota bacterium]
MLARLFIPATLGLGLALTRTAAFAAEKADGDPKDQLFSRDPFSYIWNLLMFLILLGVLWKFVWPKILGGLKAREEKQLGDLDAAEKARTEAQASLDEYKSQLAEARKEAQTIVAEARDAAQQAANADRAKIEAEVAQLKENAQRDIASAREQALADIYAQAASLSTEIAGKILGREINAEDQQGLVTESVEQFKQSASSN